MSDYPRALEITFDSVRNVGLAAALLGAAAVIIQAPSLAFNLTWLAYIEAALLAGLSVVLQVFNMGAWFLSMRRLGYSWIWLSLVGGLFIILLMHFYVAVASTSLKGLAFTPGS
ncbi:hypothetical protein [Microbulbifer variabilis]|uniref:hypothetical protein n=1 Tax=Microbulbifer variabilis TaxID=266805 RepID=UPI001CFC52F3|nr:hypothetical protein [Microbulbifer variabilis]